MPGALNAPGRFPNRALSPTEVKALYQDMLIHVTSFFRNPKSFDAMKQTVFPRIFEKKKRGDSSVRIWVPGCSSTDR